jgi:hypothetical protein
MIFTVAASKLLSIAIMPPKPSLKAKLESVFNTNKLFPARSRSPHPPSNPGDAETPRAAARPVASSSTRIDSVISTTVHPISDLESSSNGTPASDPPSVPADASISGPEVSDETGSFSKIAAVSFDGFKTVLRLIERGTDVFPPLKSTAACLLGLIDLVEVRELLMLFTNN